MFSIINSFELVALSFSWIIGGETRFLRMMHEQKKRRKKENIKISSPCIRRRNLNRVASNDDRGFASHFISWALLFLLHTTRKPRNEKSVHILYDVIFFTQHFFPHWIAKPQIKKFFAGTRREKKSRSAINCNLLVVIFCMLNAFFHNTLESIEMVHD